MKIIIKTDIELKKIKKYPTLLDCELGTNNRNLGEMDLQAWVVYDTPGWEVSPYDDDVFVRDMDEVFE